MQPLRKEKLGDMLVNAGLLTEKQLDWALEQQRDTFKRLGEILAEAELVSDDDVAEARALQLDMPHVLLGDWTIPPELASMVPESMARVYELVPVSVTNDKIAVAMSNPMDVEAIDAVQRETGKRVEPLLASDSRIRFAIGQLYGQMGVADLTASIEEAVSDVEYDSTGFENLGNLDEERRKSGEAPVIKTANLMFCEAIKQQASDIHLEPRATCVELRYRIDGVLQHVRDLPKQIQHALVSRVKIMADLDIAEKRKPQDGRIKMRIDNKNVDLRVSTLPIQYGERVVVRILDKGGQQFEVSKLGFSERERTQFETLIKRPHGIILVTGPTGSGKTSTLYSALAHIKSVETNIMTCEDPIEYELDGINQSAVNVRAGLTFAVQLRSILRQDPDVILVGEIRDGETAEVAFQAAMTGHLVFSTLHCNDAPSAVTRLVDMGVEPYLIGSSVIGVLAQRLVRNLCPRCKKAYEPSSDELAILGLEDRGEALQFYAPEGCGACSGRGYSGRMAVFELMVVSEAIRRLSVKSPTADQVRELALAAGMKTMKQHAAEKVLAGLTTVEEVQRRILVEND